MPNDVLEVKDVGQLTAESILIKDAFRIEPRRQTIACFFMSETSSYR